MRFSKKKLSYKTRLLISTALIAVVLTVPTDSFAVECSNGTGENCEISGTLDISDGFSITGNVNAPELIQGTVNAALGTSETASFAGQVFLSQLNQTGSGTLNLTGSGASQITTASSEGTLQLGSTTDLSVGTLTANKINTSATQRGALSITTSGTVTGEVYLTTLGVSGTGVISFSEAITATTMNISGSGTASFAKAVTATTMNVTGTEAATFGGSGSVNVTTLSMTGAGSLTFNNGATFTTMTASAGELIFAGTVTADTVTLNNVNTSTQQGTLTVSGTANSALNGTVKLNTLTSDNNTLAITGTTTVGTATLKNVNDSSHKQGTLTITGSGANTLSGNAYLSALSVSSGTLNYAGTVSADTVTLNNVNTSTQQGTLTITGTAASALNGTVKLNTLTSGDNTLNIAGTTTVGTATLKNVNDSEHKQGALTITGSGTNTFSGNAYLSTLSASSGTLNFTGTVSADTVTLNNVNSSRVGTLTVSGTGNSTLSGSVNLASLSSTGNTLFISGTTSTDVAVLKNVNDAGHQQGTLTITGSESPSSFTGAVYLSELSDMSGTLNFSTNVYAGKVRLNNVNSSQQGNLILSGLDSSSLNGTVYLTGIMVSGTGNLDIAETGSVNVGSIASNSINASSSDTTGTLTITGSTTSSFGGAVSLNTLNVTGTGVLGFSSDVTVLTAAVNNINSTQQGTLTISGTGNSALNGTVKLNTLTSENNTLTIAGATTAGTVSLNNVNDSSHQQGTLTITGTTESAFTGDVYLGTLSLADHGMAALTFSGETSNIGTFNLEQGTLVVNSGLLQIGSLTQEEGASVSGTGTVQLNSGSIVSTGEGTLANLAVGSGTVAVSGVSIGNVTYAATGTGILSVSGTVGVDTVDASGSGNTITFAESSTLNVASSIVANTINTSVTQRGRLSITGTENASSLSGAVYLESLSSTGTLNISGTTTVGISTLKNVNDSEHLQGTLSITGTGTSNFNGNVYLNTLSVNGTGTGALMFSGSGASSITALSLANGVLTVNNGTLKVGTFTSTVGGDSQISGTGTFQLDSGKILSTGEGTLANLKVGTGTVTVADVSIGSVTYNSIDNGSFKVDEGNTATVTTLTAGDTGNKIVLAEDATLSVTTINSYDINTNSTQKGILSITGSGNSSLNGNVYVKKLSSTGNTLGITGTVKAGSVLLNNVNNPGSQTGTLNITDTAENSQMSGSVYLDTITAVDNSVLHLSGTLTSRNVTLYNVNDALNQIGVINVTAGGTLTMNGNIYISMINVARDVNIVYGDNYHLYGTLNLSGAELTVTGMTYIYQANGGLENGIYNDNKYILGPATISTTGGEIQGDITASEVWAGPLSGSFGAGLYQNRGGGILIARSGLSDAPEFDFRRDTSEGIEKYGVIWDYSAYIPSLAQNSKVKLSNGEWVDRYEIGGNISISNGVFYGAVDIRKGNPDTLFITKTGPEANADTIQYQVKSSGNIEISGGLFYFSQPSQVKMYPTNDGNVIVSGGQWNVGYNRDETLSAYGDVTVTGSNEGLVNILGGQYKIAQNRTLSFVGNKGTLEYAASNFQITGTGTLRLGFKEFSINSAVNWEDGTLYHDGGTLTIKAPVTLDAYRMDGDNASLIIESSGVLSIKNNIRMNGEMTGLGELRLSETANAEIGTLKDFGKISVRRGMVSFFRGQSGNDYSLKYLNGAEGAIGEEIGLISINGRLIVQEVNLGNATMLLNEELIVNALNFDNGKIAFIRSDKPLTLSSSSTIWNTSTIITGDGTDSDGNRKTATYYRNGASQTTTYLPTSGTLTIKDGMTLTFDDKPDTDTDTYHFDSAYLTVNVENGAKAEFNSDIVNFNILSMTKGTAEVKKGVVSVNGVSFGDRTADAGTLTIDDGARMNVEDLAATVGSKVFANGSLYVTNLSVSGSQDEWGTLSGTGTVNVSGGATFNGRIDGLGNLVVDGTNGTVDDKVTATFDSLTGYQDSIGTMTVRNGAKVVLTHGTLTLDSLSLGGGEIHLSGETSVLALKQDPSQDDGITGDGNSIHGVGILELLNNTSITFGGGSAGSVGYLGGLRVGTGTARIEAAAENTVLGGITFTSTAGGTLQIDEGATLVIASMGGTTCERADNCKITTSSGNKVQGEGTLRLVNGDGTVFGGKVDLNTLDLKRVNVTIRFDYAGESTVNSVTTSDQDVNIVVNTGILNIESGFGTNNTSVTGTGTLFLKGNESRFTTGTSSLANLKIGSGTVHVYGGNFGTILFDTASSGTLNLENDVSVTEKIEVNSDGTSGANDITGTGKLTLYGSIGSFYTDLSEIGGLVLDDNASYNRAVAYINTSTQIGSGNDGLTLKKGTVNIASDAVLTVKNPNLGTALTEGDSPVSFVTGAGTLELSGFEQQINSTLTDLNTLHITQSSQSTIKNDAKVTNVNVDNGTTLTFSKKATLTNADVDGTLTLNGNGSVISGNTVISGTVKVNEAVRMERVSFDAANAELNIAENKTLSVYDSISVGTNNVLTGTGTLFLAENASGSLAMTQDFDGAIKIGTSATALVQTNSGIGSIEFENSRGGVLNIADGYTLTVGKIATSGENKITGAGSLKLNGAGQTSVFGAPINDLGAMVVTNSAIAKFDNANRNISISRLSFNEGAGGINIARGTTITITELLQQDPDAIGSVYGEGTMIAGTGMVALSTGGLNQSLAQAVIGTGQLNFISDSHIGTLQYSSTNGIINIGEDVTVQIDSSFSGIGILSGPASAKLQLTGQSDATFYKAIEYHGSISAETGNLTFLSDTDFKKLSLNGTTVNFDRETSIDELTMSTGAVEFRLASQINNLTISSTGSVLFKDRATLGAINVGAGTVKFRADSTMAGGSVSAGGMLDIDVNKITIDSGNFAFNNNSTLSMRISRAATDDYGNVNETGYGRIVMNGGTLSIGANVNLNMAIDYGVRTSANGSVFKLIEGNQYNEFVFSNNRYKLEKATCEGGLCYRLVQTSSAGEYTQEESGNQNQVNIASAFLDGELFEDGTKAFTVAERLDAISQNGVSKQYLNALTALAPDVSGGMSSQPLSLQSKISDTLSGRMVGLSGNLGSSSRTYRDIQKMYGRSGGSPYRTRFMRSSDYYRRAGYYDQYDEPMTKTRPAYRRQVLPNSVEAEETAAEHKRWAKRRTSYSVSKEFGAWGQTFYNMADYLSKDKPDGFSGKTTGFAIGADAQLFDVFAIGLGYASTSSSVDSLQRKTDVDGTSLFMYGMYKPHDWFISSVLNMSSMTYNEVKNVAGISLKDKYKGSSLGFSMMFGKEIGKWTPAVGVRYVSSDRKAHTDEIGQRISGISTSVTTLVAEGRMNQEFAKSDSSSWHSELSAVISYDLSAAGEDATVSLPNGSSYTVKGEDFSAIGVELGGTLSWLYGEHVDISAGYNLEWRQDYLSHTLTATFRYTF